MKLEQIWFYLPGGTRCKCFLKIPFCNHVAYWMNLLNSNHVYVCLLFCCTMVSLLKMATLIDILDQYIYHASWLQDVYLHTNCLSTLANMAPHCHRLSAYASERLISLFDMLSRKYSYLFHCSCYGLKFPLLDHWLYQDLYLHCFAWYRYNKLAEQRDGKILTNKGNLQEEEGLTEDMVQLQ